MFLSSRLAALSTLSITLFISNVFGLVIPLEKRFVSTLSSLLDSYAGISTDVFEFFFIEINFVMVVQNFALVNTETSPLPALMTHSLPAKTLLRVRIKFAKIPSRWGRFI